jgi:hypothetical protein
MNSVLGHGIVCFQLIYPQVKCAYMHIWFTYWYENAVAYMVEVDEWVGVLSAHVYVDGGGGDDVVTALCVRHYIIVYYCIIFRFDMMKCRVNESTVSLQSWTTVITSLMVTYVIRQMTSWQSYNRHMWLECTQLLPSPAMLLVSLQTSPQPGEQRTVCIQTHIEEQAVVRNRGQHAVPPQKQNNYIQTL